MTKPKVETESKADRFIRLAQNRTSKILKYMRLLGNCSNKSNYEYTDEQIEQMLNSIYEALDTIQSKFYSHQKNKDKFTF